jgi:hypothetical protein
MQSMQAPPKQHCVSSANARWTTGKQKRSDGKKEGAWDTKTISHAPAQQSGYVSTVADYTPTDGGLSTSPPQKNAWGCSPRLLFQEA